MCQPSYGQFVGMLDSEGVQGCGCLYYQQCLVALIGVIILVNCLIINPSTFVQAEVEDDPFHAQTNSISSHDQVTPGHTILHNVHLFLHMFLHMCSHVPGQPNSRHNTYAI